MNEKPHLTLCNNIFSKYCMNNYYQTIVNIASVSLHFALNASQGYRPSDNNNYTVDADDHSLSL